MKIIIFASGAMLSASVTLPAAARQSDHRMLIDIASCREIAKADDRLQCFDKYTKVLGAYLDAENKTAALSETTNSSSIRSQTTTPAHMTDDVNPIAAFGAEDMAQRDNQKALKELRSRAVSITTNNRGKYIIALENGQIWRQLQSDTNTLRVRRKGSEDGHDVIIKKRSLGAYALRLTAAKRSILVRRIK